MANLNRFTYVSSALFTLAGASLLLLSVYPKAIDTLQQNRMSDITTQLPGFPPDYVSTHPENSVIEEHPIFVPGRRPPPAATLSDSEDHSTPATNLPFSLKGIVITNGHKLALIQHGAEPNLLSLQVGQSSDGWIIQDIRSNTVVVTSGASKQFLHLPDYKKNIIEDQ